MKRLFEIPNPRFPWPPLDVIDGCKIDIDPQCLALFAKEVGKTKVDIVTIRDYKIILFLSEGMIAKEIGDALELSPRTIETKIHDLKTIFKAHTHAHLVSTMFIKRILK